MAGLRVGRPVGVLHPWGVSGYSPLAQGHPTSTCDAGVN